MIELNDIKTKFAERLFEKINTFGVNRNRFEFEFKFESIILQIAGTFHAGYENGNLEVNEIELKAVFCFDDFEAELGQMYVDEIKKFIIE